MVLFVVNLIMFKPKSDIPDLPLLFARTPPEFYKSTSDSGRDPADTAKNSVGVLDKHGNVKVSTCQVSKLRQN